MWRKIESGDWYLPTAPDLQVTLLVVQTRFIEFELDTCRSRLECLFSGYICASDPPQ